MLYRESNFHVSVFQALEMMLWGLVFPRECNPLSSFLFRLKNVASFSFSFSDVTSASVELTTGSSSEMSILESAVILVLRLRSFKGSLLIFIHLEGRLVRVMVRACSALEVIVPIPFPSHCLQLGRSLE